MWLRRLVSVAFSRVGGGTIQRFSAAAIGPKVWTEAREQTAVIMPNMVKYAKEHGVELPPELMAQMESAR